VISLLLSFQGTHTEKQTTPLLQAKHDDPTITKACVVVQQKPLFFRGGPNHPSEISITFQGLENPPSFVKVSDQVVLLARLILTHLVQKEQAHFGSVWD